MDSGQPHGPGSSPSRSPTDLSTTSTLARSQSEDRNSPMTTMEEPVSPSTNSPVPPTNTASSNERNGPPQKQESLQEQIQQTVLTPTLIKQSSRDRPPDSMDYLYQKSPATDDSRMISSPYSMDSSCSRGGYQKAALSPDSMETTSSDAPMPGLTRMSSQDREDSSRPDSNPYPLMSQGSMDGKTVVVHSDVNRLNGKEGGGHVVTVTPPSVFPSSIVTTGLIPNGTPSQDPTSKYTAASSIRGYHKPESGRSIGGPSSASPLNLQYLTKDYKAEPEIEKPNEETTYHITCGSNVGELVWKKFICPGINAKCVRIGDTWLTPKEFVNVAGKQTLKDWKRAIRIKGIMLRRLIENGELNYYDHDNNCSNQCRSSKSSSFDNGKDAQYSSFDDPMPTERDTLHPVHPIRSNSDDIAYSISNIKRLPPSFHRQPLDGTHNLPQVSSIERSSSEDSGITGSPLVDNMIMRDAAVSVEKAQDLQTWWSGIVRMDLFDDIFEDCLLQIKNLRLRAKQSQQISLEDSVILTNIVNSLEMIPAIRQRMTLQKSMMEQQTEVSNATIQELERKLLEEKNAAQELKRKSEHLDSFIHQIPVEKRPKRQMMKLLRQKAVNESTLPRGPGGLVACSSAPVQPRLSQADLQLAQARLPPREMWPRDMISAASSQMARMNVSGQGAGIPPMFFTNPHDVYASPQHLHQFLQSVQQQSREHSNPQSPKK